MRIVTWNVNSLKARLSRVVNWLDAFEPDVLCLQETKMVDDDFPEATFNALGYDCHIHGQLRWNGVAILSKVGIVDPLNGFGDGIEEDPDARVTWATCGDVRVASCYIPNGRSLDDPHYQYKLSWLERLKQSLDTQCAPSDPVVLVGDFNIAPDDRDVHDPAKFTNRTHASPPERQRLEELMDWGLTDLFRIHHDDGGLFSWWDYRAGSFANRKGMRIDLLLGSKPVADASTYCLVDRNERKGPKDDPPSDHAPVFVDVSL